MPEGRDHMPGRLERLLEEWAADEAAGRARELGEEAAATHDARMAEACRLLAEEPGLSPPDPPPVGPGELDRIVGELERGWREAAPPGSTLGRTLSRQPATPKEPGEGRDR
ncbi:hypothetical protein [Tautonia rosea]|uniref:hypothetical protein n=1 Tax=Tautonia rosea TaxID=2728037 RepID=UPI001473D8AA|nr:hypothetical protein [Tautonia rosea]